MYFPTIILIACISQFSDAKKLDLGEVIFTNILFRHGDRTPFLTYPNDPHWETVGKFPPGELTNLGKLQQLELGRWFRKRYSQLLPELYFTEDIYVRSTDVDRTLASAEVNLAGLYPPRGNQVWSNISWLPIPVHTLPPKLDNVLAAQKPCPLYDFEFDEVSNSPAIKQVLEQNKELLDYLTEHSGDEVRGLRDVAILYDTLYIQQVYNASLPEWANSVYPDKMKPLVELYYMLPASTPILRQLKSGLLLNEMATYFEEKFSGKLMTGRKIRMYSAHDGTVVNLLNTLNILEPHVPPYAATVLLELRITSKKRPVVTIWYKNSTEPVLMTLPNCTAACPLEKFLVLTEPVRINEKKWTKKCYQATSFRARHVFWEFP